MFSNPIIVGAIIALFGTIIGSLLPFVSKFFNRIWSIKDRKYERRVFIVDKRCNQAETYAQATTQDFRLLMHDIEAFIAIDDRHLAEQRLRSREYWKNKLDTRIFSLGPSIHSLDNDDLKQKWDKMMESMDKLHEMYKSVYVAKYEQMEVLDYKQIAEDLNNIWLAYSKELGSFYSILDEIRYELTEEKYEQKAV